MFTSGSEAIAFLCETAAYANVDSIIEAVEFGYLLDEDVDWEKAHANAKSNAAKEYAAKKVAARQQSNVAKEAQYQKRYGNLTDTKKQTNANGEWTQKKTGLVNHGTGNTSDEMMKNHIKHNAAQQTAVSKVYQEQDKRRTTGNGYNNLRTMNQVASATDAFERHNRRHARQTAAYIKAGKKASTSSNATATKSSLTTKQAVAAGAVGGAALTAGSIAAKKLIDAKKSKKVEAKNEEAPSNESAASAKAARVAGSAIGGGLAGALKAGDPKKTYGAMGAGAVIGAATSKDVKNARDEYKSVKANDSAAKEEVDAARKKLLAAKARAALKGAGTGAAINTWGHIGVGATKAVKETLAEGKKK